MTKRWGGKNRKENYIETTGRRLLSQKFYLRGPRYHISAVTEKELMIKYGKMLQQLADGSLLINQNSTVEQWSEVWLDTYKKGNMTDKSFLTYQQKLDGYILPAIGKMKMKDVREPHLQRILNDEHGRSFSHVSKLRMVIRGMFARAYSARIINRDPAANLVLPKTTKGTHRKLTERERAAVLAVADRDEHNTCLWVKLMLYCGLRPGETAALQWKDIDFKNGILHVTKAKESGSNVIKSTKTEAGNRDIPIPVELLEELKQKQRGPFETVLHQTRNESKPHTESSMKAMWHSFKRLVDIEMGAKVFRLQVIEHGEPDELYESLTPYCFRHTFCTDLQDAGVPLNVAKYLMGHKDITMTANIYTHTTEEIVRQAAVLTQKHEAKQRKKREA